MRLTPHIFVTVIFAGLATTAGAADSGWDEWLARKLSGRLRVIEQELEKLPPQLDGLPSIPVADQGGTGGWASIHSSATPAAGTRHAVEIRWKQPAVVDFVALVPARRYDARGLDPQYGTPGAFTVELIDAAGATLAVVARERNIRSNPVRNGHPFIYQVTPAVAAAGLRVTADVLRADFEDRTSFVHAWAEVIALEGNHNVARRAEVKAIGGTSPPAPWHWASGFLVDEQTPLGLPEIPAPAHTNVGWLSEGRPRADMPTGVTLDLGKTAAMDAIRLLPAKRPTPDLPSGFGFPRKVEISVADQPNEWRVVATGEFSNPGHNPVVMPLNAAHGRYVRVMATELWRVFESYPAFFALSEIEVLSGNQNIALGKPVRSADGMQNLIAPGGRSWTSAALSDGHGPDGRLVPTHDWLSQLNKRLEIETRLHDLGQEAERVIAGWRRAGVTVFALLGLAGAFAIIAVPVRYRIRANRELLQVRERIAGDLHDEVGSNLGSIQMFADLAESRSGASEELKRIQRIAAETVSAVRDIVWLLRPGGDHRIATIEHLRETSSIMLESLQWKFSASDDAWGLELPEEANRDLFLFFREALHNILRHARAHRVTIHAEADASHLILRIEDDGCGIASDRLERPATLRALRQRTEALRGTLTIDSQPGAGTRLELRVPLRRLHRRRK